MVSNSGTMLIALRPRGVDEPDFLQQQRDLEQVGDALAHRDDALRDRAGAELGVRFGGGVEHREFAQRLLAVVDERRRQRPRDCAVRASAARSRASSLSAR